MPVSTHFKNSDSRVSKNRKSQASSPDKDDPYYMTRVDGSKEKEEDFMAMKGCKLPQRPKKRAKFIQKCLLSYWVSFFMVHLVTPGAWLSDLSHERYEVREKKCSRKRRRGLKAMHMESELE
ncbi:hypothetical protein QJS10_CPA06g01565 [Acorus calamus]|uniref:Uncharacterized protein n=1 Tax=Acorus calamus TaxID=4465 RepID=A0AAV9EK19_ACOCL|nr:hypothetical protein QJS10_CPA06g01565 [Acorus calamus]